MQRSCIGHPGSLGTPCISIEHAHGYSVSRDTNYNMCVLFFVIRYGGHIGCLLIRWNRVIVSETCNEREEQSARREVKRVTLK